MVHRSRSMAVRELGLSLDSGDGSYDHCPTSMFYTMYFESINKSESKALVSSWSAEILGSTRTDQGQKITSNPQIHHSTFLFSHRLLYSFDLSSLLHIKHRSQISLISCLNIITRRMMPRPPTSIRRHHHHRMHHRPHKTPNSIKTTYLQHLINSKLP
jgi:hypothetical protein